MDKLMDLISRTLDVTISLEGPDYVVSTWKDLELLEVTADTLEGAIDMTLEELDASV